jgi:hypothetical protein
MCWRLTFALPVVFARRFAVWLSPDVAWPCSLLSSMMMRSRLPSF